MFAISRDAGGDDRRQQVRSLSEKLGAVRGSPPGRGPAPHKAIARSKGPSSSGGRSNTGERAKSEFQQLLAYALKALARREHSTVELRRKMGIYISTRAGESARQTEEHINQVIEALSLDGSLSDERFTSEYVRLRIDKGYGPIRIRMELLERGIPDRLAEESLIQPAEFWQTLAAEVCARKFGDPGGQLDDQQTQRRWNRCARFLSQRGFPADLIYQTLEGRLVD